MPVVVSFAVTVAPGMMAPFWSMTRPLIVTLSRSCACAIIPHGGAHRSVKKKIEAQKVATGRREECISMIHAPGV
jgi:hypothetical protein